MSESDMAWKRFKTAIDNQGKIVDMNQKWHDLAMQGSCQSRKQNRFMSYKGGIYDKK